MSEAKVFQSCHNLPFEVAPWYDPKFERFRIGTCEGLWRSTYHTYDILAITNNNPGNGHFQDVLEWFENSCRRDAKALRFLEIFNERFGQHLIEKQGFKRQGPHLIKKFKNDPNR